MQGVTFPIRTERLLLRPFEMDDLPAVHEMQRHEEVARYLYWAPRSLEQSRESLAQVVHLRALDAEHDGVRLAAIRVDTDELIGDISLWRTSREHNQGEIGFIFHPDHQGRGFATEGAREALRIGFEVAGLHRIVGRCDGRNAPSARLMERLGMRREAHFVENELVKDEWTDELVYAMLAAEWPRHRSGGR